MKNIYIIVIGIAFISLFNGCATAGSISYGPNSCGHGFQGVEVFLHNSSDKTIQFTIKMTSEAANNTRRVTQFDRVLTQHSKRSLGCTKGNFSPPLSMQFQVIKRVVRN